MSLLRALSVALLAATATPAGAELRLVMVEQPGCAWCARWHAEVGDAYAATDEGRAAPLWRVNRLEPLPEGLALARPAVFTPTFVLVHHGTELGRIEGYPGEHFFWPLLGRLIDTAPTDPQEDTTQ